MKLVPLAFAAALLAGCSAFDQISYGSWLDHVGERKPARYPFASEETQALQARAVELHARADTVRLKLAGERDRTRRIAAYSQLEDIDDELRPIEKQLREKGTNSRRYPPPPDYVQGGGQ